MNTETVLFGFYYNPMTWESAPDLTSLHRTKEGAEKAMAWHKEEKRKEFEARYKGKEKPFEFGYFEEWFVEEIKVQD